MEEGEFVTGYWLREIAFSEIYSRIEIIELFKHLGYTTQMGSRGPHNWMCTSSVCSARYLDHAVLQCQYAYDFALSPSTQVGGIFRVFNNNGTAHIVSNVTSAALL